MDFHLKSKTKGKLLNHARELSTDKSSPSCGPPGDCNTMTYGESLVDNGCYCLFAAVDGECAVVVVSLMHQSLCV